MSSRQRAWDERVRQIEDELSERGPAETDDRKVRFLIAAYLRDIRDQLTRQAPGITAPARRSSWDVEGERAPEDDGDTRPFAFIEELRVPKKKKEPEAKKADEGDDDGKPR